MKQMKVFLSHSTKDKDFVQKLAAEIESANIEPWHCEVDVIPGDDFVAEIERGLRESDLTVLVWSPNAAASAWTGEEWRSVLARQVEESRTRLLIVMLREAELPELLRKRHFIDARSNPDAALRETISWLKRQRDMRKFSESKAATILLDYEPVDFVGREAYLEDLHKALVESRGKLLLWGEAGSGKSLLALKFAWRAQGAFDAVVFQHCGQRPADQVGVELAAKLGLDVKERPPDQAIQGAKAWLCERRTLLVLDDIWNPDIKNLIPGPPLPVGALSVLCTSRQRSFPWIEASRRIEVKSFVDEEAESVFRIYLGEETTSQNRDSLLALAARVERLPIAVAVAAEMLSRQFGPLGEAARGIELARLKNEIHDVPGLLQRAIESQPEREQRLLRAMAVCHPDGFWFPLAAAVSGLDKAAAEESRDRLVIASLVRLLDPERQRFRLHALLREQLLKTAPLEELQQKYTDVLSEFFKNWETSGKKCLEFLPEVVPAIQILRNAGLRDRMLWLAREGFKASQRHGELEAALRILKEEMGFWNDREDQEAKNGLQRVYGNQAGILKTWGQLEKALALLERQETISHELGDKDSLAKTYGNQALIMKAWGRLEEALTLLKKQELLCLELNNMNGLEISYGNQAGIMLAWGQLEKALVLLKKQEVLCRELDKKFGLQASYGGQALILKAWGKLEEALALHKKEEALCRELGDKDGLARTYGNQALILKAWGKLEEALTLHQKEEALCRELGNKGSIGYCYWNWGLLAREMKDRHTEREKLQAALQIFTELKMPRERDAVQEELEKTSKPARPSKARPKQPKKKPKLK